jgi:hypothetical protein
LLTVSRGSLAATLDAVNEAFFYQRRLSASERTQAATWIASRQGMPDSYRGVMFAPTERDFREGIRLFTGETVRTRAGTAHILGEEACRALILLDARSSGVREALARATEGMTVALRKVARSGRWRATRGQYCCGKCTIALWRHLAVGGATGVGPGDWIAAGMKALMSDRDGKGQWKRFPFWYTLLALSDIEIPSASAELRYAAPRCERYLRRSRDRDAIGKRRRDLAERILSRC